MAEPVRGIAYQFPVGLGSVLSTGFQVSPTIAAGDFQISRDSSAFANLATLPVVSPSGSTSVLISLSSTEMTADKIVIYAKDAAGDEWNELRAFIDVPVGNSESVYDLMVGDHIETQTTQRVNKAGTSNAILNKTVGGSLLSPSVTITTVDT